MARESKATYEDVAAYMDDCYSQGVDPSLRSVIRAVGGNSASTTKHYHEYNKTRQADIAKMTQELGSSKIAEILASEIKILVTQRTLKLQESIARYEKQLAELTGIMGEHEKECERKVNLAESDKQLEIAGMAEKLNKAIKTMEDAKDETKDALEELAQTKGDTQQAIDKAEQKAQVLVDAANQRADKAEEEANSLREQVKQLTVDEAKREIEKALFNDTQNQLDGMRITLADKNTEVVKLTSEKEMHERDAVRLSKELETALKKADQFSKSQAELIEAQKQLNQVKHDLVQAERERDSLTVAIRSQDKR
ncbi:MAG: hypothetical protein GJ680_07780 [Alteromonadaceae bacterium]|nr:hypothetical protein [Alteromonadaceae bacterium]